MVVSTSQACLVFSGRNPDYWNTLDNIVDDANWNIFVNSYNDLENELDNGTLTGITPCPVRPRPITR